MTVKSANCPETFYTGPKGLATGKGKIKAQPERMNVYAQIAS